VNDPNVGEDPTELGAFTIIGRLGEGGSGVVYHARWGHREVALKILRDYLVDTESEKNRFFDEARILSEITHPGVVKVLNYGALPDGRPYLAMEMLNGETLAVRLKRGALRVSEALHLFDQLAAAVAAMHVRGLVHRDLKPENVYLVEDGRYAVLLDFGIAKELDAPASTVTQEGGIRGTPAYMAPERFFGQPATQRTDIYELGVVLYTMVVGGLPWVRATDPEDRLNPRRPSELGVSLPGDLEAQLLRAMSTRPEARHGSVAEFAHTVRSAANLAPVEVKRTTADIAAAAGQDLIATTPRRPVDNVAKTDPNADGFAQTMISTQREPLPQHTPGLPSHQTPYGGAEQQALHGGVAHQTPHGAAALQTRFGAMAPPDSGAAAHQTPLGAMAPPDSAHHKPDGYAPHPSTQPQPAKPSRKGMWLGISFVVLAIVGGAVLAFVLSGDATESKAALVSQEEESKSGTSEPPAQQSEPKATIADSSWPERGADDGLTRVVRHHPIDTEILVGLRVRDLRNSQALAGLVARLMKITEVEQLTMVGKMCDIDPIRSIEWVSVGVSPSGSDELEIVVSGDFTRDNLESCISRLANFGEAAIEVTRSDSITRLVVEGDPFGLAWIDDNTVLLTTRKTVKDEWLKQRAKGTSPSLADRLTVDPQIAAGTVWFVGDPSEIAKEVDAPDGLGTPTAMALSVAVAADIRVRGQLEYATEQNARKAKVALDRGIRSVRAQAGPYLSELELTVDGPLVVVNWYLNASVTSLIVGLALMSIEQEFSKK